MALDLEIFITFGILALIGFWIISKFKKQTMKETLADTVDLIKGAKGNE